MRRILAGQIFGIEIADHAIGTIQQAQLGVAVILEILVTVEVILADIEHGRHRGFQRLRGFELEARQFEHIVLVALFQQIEGRNADIAAHAGRDAGGLEDAADQSRHRALAVGAGDCDDRLVHCFGKQFDIADDALALRRQIAQERIAHRQPRADHQAIETSCIQGLQRPVPKPDTGALLMQGIETGRLLPIILHFHRVAPLLQVARRRESAQAQTQHQIALVGMQLSR